MSAPFDPLADLATEELKRGLALMAQMDLPPEKGEIWLRAWFTTADLVCLMATAAFACKPPELLEVNGVTLFGEAAQLGATRPKNFELFWIVRHALDGVLSYTYLIPHEGYCQTITVPGSLPNAAEVLFDIENSLWEEES